MLKALSKSVRSSSVTLSKPLKSDLIKIILGKNYEEKISHDFLKDFDDFDQIENSL